MDGFTVVSKGVPSGAAPIAIPRDQLAWATNIDARTSFIKPRPGWEKRILRFENAAGVIDPALQASFEDAIFQGAIVFERQSKLVTMIGGHLFRIDPAFWNVTDVTPSSGGVYDANANDKYRAWFAEAEYWVIAQDGVSIPMIFDGASTVRSDTIGAGGKAQIPIGKAMVYSQGRLMVAYSNGREFVIGDIVGGDSGTAPYNFRDAVLYFTENDVINGGGAFSTPINSGFITAFRPVAQVDTSTGQGPTQVFTTGGIFSMNLPYDRTTWSTVNFPIGTVSNVNNGALSDRATVNVNGDIWFRSIDGVRSFVVARRDFQTWVNAPLSHEESRGIDHDDKSLLSYASAACFDNKLLMTVRPYRSWGHGIVHQGLAVLDFEPVTAITERSMTPTWLGLGTGVEVLQVLTGMLNGVQRCFAFTLSPSSTIELWELSTGRTSDSNGVTNTPIQWTWETAAFPFVEGSLPGREMLSLDGGRLYVDEIEGDVTFTLYYRTDQDPCWHDWHTWTICATQVDCDVGATCGPPGSLRRQYRKPFNLPTPSGCDDAVNKRLNWGREFQVRGVVTGWCRIKMLELLVHQEQEAVTALCAPNESCEIVSCCPPNDYAYAIETRSIEPTPR